jgi:DNA-binding FadR family transcriptional regulator
MFSQDETDAASGESSRVFEGICENIRAQIASGALKPGDRLPAERELAERYNVGRNAVREALRTLEIAGVVRLQKGRNGGPYIRPASPHLVTNAIQGLIGFGSLEWGDITEARSLILDLVVRLVAERATAADYDAMERNVHMTEEALRDGRIDEYAIHAYEFYTLLARCTRNSVLTLLVTSMSDLVRRFVNTNFDTALRTPLATLVPLRKKVIGFLRAGNSDRAAAELQAQLQLIHVRINGWIAQQRSGKRATTRAEHAGARQLATLEAENARLLAELKALKTQRTAIGSQGRRK